MSRGEIDRHGFVTSGTAGLVGEREGGALDYTGEIRLRSNAAAR
jgi:hypothetical protein